MWHTCVVIDAKASVYIWHKVAIFLVGNIVPKFGANGLCLQSFLVFICFFNYPKSFISFHLMADSYL